jgi:hypothetical protein
MKTKIVALLVLVCSTGFAGEVGNGPDLSGEALPVQADRLIEYSQIQAINTRCNRKFMLQAAEVLMGSPCATDVASLNRFTRKASENSWVCVSKKYLTDPRSVADGDVVKMHDTNSGLIVATYIRKNANGEISDQSTSLLLRTRPRAGIVPYLDSSKLFDVSTYNAVGARLGNIIIATYGADLQIIGNDLSSVFFQNAVTDRVVPLEFSIEPAVSCLIDELNALE